MKHHRIAGYSCPGCGGYNEMATNVGSPEAETPPRPGDFAVCFKCGCLLTYTAGGARRITAEDEQRMSAETSAIMHKARQLIMDRDFVDEKLHRFDGDPAHVKQFVEAAKARGDVPIIIGTRCADGPPGPRQRPAKRAPCARCSAPVWIRSDAPDVPVSCSRCAAKLLERMARGRV